MTKDEFGLLVVALKTYYPREDRLLPNKQAAELWFRELEDIPYEIADAVLRQWVATNKWSPGISDIRSLAADAACGVQDTWGQAWEQVQKAIHKFGSYNETDALASLDDLTRRSVECMGWRELCLSETAMQDRAQFRQIYENLANRQRTDRQIPQQVRVMISGLRQNKALGEGMKKLFEWED